MLQAKERPSLSSIDTHENQSLDSESPFSASREMAFERRNIRHDKVTNGPREEHGGNLRSMSPKVPTPERNGSDTSIAKESSRERILSAALEQFAEKGFAGVRVDEVAISAGTNKQLIYYYFGGKSELYDASFDRLIELTDYLWADVEAAPTLAEAIECYRRQDSPAAVIWHRFLAWEGVEYATRNESIRREDVRTETWQRLVKVVQQAQLRGELSQDLDASMFALLLTSFIGTPLVLPQVAKMITQTDPNGADFARRQGDLFDSLLAALRP